MVTTRTCCGTVATGADPRATQPARQQAPASRPTSTRTPSLQLSALRGFALGVLRPPKTRVHVGQYVMAQRGDFRIGIQRHALERRRLGAGKIVSVQARLGEI